MSDLRQLQDVSFETYEENKLVHRTVERTLHLAVEACLDMDRHIIAQKGFRTPEENRDVFIVLYDEKIVPSELLEKLTAMAGFRNLIVHNYAQIDHATVYSILKRHLDDFEAFAQVMAGYVAAE